MLLLKFTENSMSKLGSAEFAAFGKLALIAAGWGLAAFALSAGVNYVLDHGIVGDATMLQGRLLKFFIANQMVQIPIGM